MGILLYIDPGTGSMLFTILIGLIGAGIYSLRMLVIKLKFFLSGGKSREANTDRLPFVIFSDDKRYWNIFEPVCREFDRRGLDITYMTASPDDPGLNSGLTHVRGEFIGEGNAAFAKLNFLKADIVLSTTPGLDVYQWKRSRDVKYYAHILHHPGNITMYRMFGIDYYDALLLSGDFQVKDARALEELRKLPAKDIEVVGLPHMDVMKARLDREGVIKNDRPVVLVAPTWGPGGILTKFGEKLLEMLSRTDYHIIIRPHPQSWSSEKQMLDKLMEKFPASERIEWNRDNDNFEILRRSDIMISDFSGVVFEFTLIFDKPLIYSPAEIDVSLNDAWWLDTPLWTKSALPRIGIELNEEIVADLDRVIEESMNSEALSRGREEVRNEVWKCRGEGAKNTVDFLINKYSEITKDIQEKK